MNFGITESPHVVTNLGKNVFLKKHFSWDNEDFM